MNFQVYINDKQNKGDILAKERTVSLYVSQTTEGLRFEEDIKTFTKVELFEPSRQRIKKRRAYEIPLL
jgi:hypothetical protein